MNTRFELGFGPHLTLDLSDCNVDRLSDPAHILRLLNDLPEQLGMRKIAEPYIIDYPPQEHTFDKGGVTAFVLIAESHISIHTFKEQRYAFVDIFSCKPFDVDKAVAYFVDHLGARKHSVRLFDRGLEFPKEIPAVSKFLKHERTDITPNPPKY